MNQIRRGELNMNANEYQKSAVRFVSNIDCRPEQSQLLMAALGVAGEAGEFADLIKKYIFHGTEFDGEHAIKELGDICWYIALACTVLGVSLESVLDINIKKLEARYPDNKFTVEHANNRKSDDI